MVEIKKVSSVWKIGAVIAAIITILAAVPVIYMSWGRAPIWQSFAALLAPFPISWLICSLLVWLWRRTARPS
jgi:hypothetical protein